MSSAVFGKAFYVDWAPAVNGEIIAAYELVSARVYSSAPSQAQIEATATGHVQEVTAAWAEQEESFGYRISFDAIEDPTPHDSDPYDTYYVVIRFRFESGGEIKFDKEVLYMWRPDSVTSKVSVSADRIKERELKAKDLRTDSQIEKHIDVAKRRVFRHLMGLGYEKRRVFNLDNLNDAVEEAALASLCRDLAGENNQVWLRKAEMYDKAFGDMLKATPVNYDASGDDVPDIRADVERVNAIYLVR